MRKVYRTLLKVTPRWTVSKMIGPYGPFKLDRYFAFSNFEKCGTRHNKGFQASIEASRGKRSVLDIGAHIGLVTMPMSRVAALGGTVYAFEPAEVNRGLLIQHLSDNNISNVVVLPYLVGDSEEDEVAFFEEEQPSGGVMKTTSDWSLFGFFNHPVFVLWLGISSESAPSLSTQYLLFGSYK